MVLTKTTKLTVLPMTSTPNGWVVAGTRLDVAPYYSGLLRIRLGRSVFAYIVSPQVRVEVSPKTAPTAQDWVVCATVQMAKGASIAYAGIPNAAPAGQTTLEVDDGSNLAAGDYVFIRDDSLDYHNSEWLRVLSRLGYILTLEEPTVFPRGDYSDTITDQAEQHQCLVNLTTAASLRVVVSAVGAGGGVMCEVTGSFTSGI